MRFRRFACVALLVPALIAGCEQGPPPIFTATFHNGAELRNALLDSLPIGTPRREVDAFLQRHWFNCTPWDTGRPTAILSDPARVCELAEWQGRRAIFEATLFVDRAGRLSRIDGFRLYYDRDTAYANANGITLDLPDAAELAAQRAYAESLGVTNARPAAR